MWKNYVKIKKINLNINNSYYFMHVDACRQVINVLKEEKIVQVHQSEIIIVLCSKYWSNKIGKKIYDGHSPKIIINGYVAFREGEFCYIK